MPRNAFTNNDASNSCIGIDDGPFPRKTPDKPSKAPLLAVSLKGPHVLRLQVGWITVDGLDATQQAQTLLRGLQRGPVLLSGVTFGGFNLIDPHVINKQFKTPTIVVVGSQPDNRAVKRALVKHFPDWRKRWDIIRSLGPLRRVRTVADEPPIFYETVGFSAREARMLLRNNALVSRVPEPIRVAGFIARGLFAKPVA